MFVHAVFDWPCGIHHHREQWHPHSLRNYERCFWLSDNAWHFNFIRIVERRVRTMFAIEVNQWLSNTFPNTLISTTVGFFATQLATATTLFGVICWDHNDFPGCLCIYKAVKFCHTNVRIRYHLIQKYRDRAHFWLPFRLHALFVQKFYMTNW